MSVSYAGCWEKPGRGQGVVAAKSDQAVNTLAALGPCPPDQITPHKAHLLWSPALCSLSLRE